VGPQTINVQRPTVQNTCPRRTKFGEQVGRRSRKSQPRTSQHSQLANGLGRNSFRIDWPDCVGLA
jgi:hypothetical protein